MPCAHSSDTSLAAPGREILAHSESSACGEGVRVRRARRRKVSLHDAVIAASLKHLPAAGIHGGIAITLRDGKRPNAWAMT